MVSPYDSYDYQSYWVGREFEDCCERLVLNRWLVSLKNRDSLVDIGGGFGRLSSTYTPLFKQCVVVEPAQKLIDFGKKENGKYKNLFFKRGSLPALPLANSSFDAALLIRVSHHLPDLWPSLNEIARILKEDGFLILEVANKIHFLARMKAFLSGDFSFCRNLEPMEKRSQENIRENSIAFSNHHPRRVFQDLNRAGFVIKEVCSVSNFRQPLLKKIIPQKILLFLEKNFQKRLGSVFFGPSIFILSQKGKL